MEEKEIKNEAHLQIIRECKFKLNNVKKRWEYLIYKHLTTSDTDIILSIAYDNELAIFILIKQTFQKGKFTFWEEQTPLQINNSSDVAHLKKIINFTNMNITKKNTMKKITTFEDACKVTGNDPLKLQEFYNTLPEDTAAYEKLKIITKALNEGWEPDWSNHDQWKYYPYFRLSPSLGGFSFDDCARDYAASGVGSLLCFKSRELAEYAAKQFKDIYEVYFTK